MGEKSMERTLIIQRLSTNFSFLRTCLQQSNFAQRNFPYRGIIFGLHESLYGDQVARLPIPALVHDPVRLAVINERKNTSQHLKLEQSVIFYLPLRRGGITFRIDPFVYCHATCKVVNNSEKIRNFAGITNSYQRSELFEFTSPQLIKSIFRFRPRLYRLTLLTARNTKTNCPAKRFTNFYTLITVTGVVDRCSVFMLFYSHGGE